MNRYKNLTCECGKRLTAPNGKTKPCPQCGLNMRVGENWYLRYEHNGKQITEASTSRLVDVEKRMAALKLQLASGRLEKEEAPILWEDAVKEFKLYNTENKKSDATIAFYNAMLKPLTATFAYTPLQEITKKMVTAHRTERLKVIGAKTANHEIMVLKRLFSVMMDEYSGRVYKDLHISGAEISRIADIPETAKSRCLTMTEIKTIWKNMEILPGAQQRALKLILLTGQRPGEVTGICKKEIDGQWWTIPAERSKNRIANRVWLSEEAAKLAGDIKLTRLAVSRSLLRLKEGPRVFGIPYFTPHDLRRTMATQLAQMEISDEVIDAILNHTKKGVIKVYNLYKYDKQKKEALDAWSAKLTSFLTTEIGQVIPLTPAKPAFKRISFHTGLHTGRVVNRCHKVSVVEK